MKFKLHYNPSYVNGDRFCHQDNLRGGCTTVIANVTCKKCLRSVIKQSKLRGNRKRANEAASALIVMQAKEVLGPNMELFDTNDKEVAYTVLDNK